MTVVYSLLAVGHDVFKKNNDRQLEVFNTKLMQHENEVKQQLERERDATLTQLGLEHERSIESLKQRYNVMMVGGLIL